MKYNIWCKLFGHYWIRVGEDEGEYPSDWCTHCGLSKLEAGITPKEQGK